MYLRRFFIPSLKQLFRGNFDYFNLGIANNLLPPRSFFFIFLPLLVIAGFLIAPVWGIASLALLVLFALSLVLGVPASLVNKDLFRALLRLPRAVWTMFGTLLHIKKANKTFIHTVHTKTEVSNSLFNEKTK